MDRVGQHFGDYHLIRLIGQGGFADVYLGEHSRRKTLVAVKVLHARLANDNVKAFLNEARSFRLKHPRIVQILDFGLEDDFPFLIMEYAPNGSLRQRHPRRTQLPLDMIVSYIRQIADALQYAHNEGVVHRDIKPDNMLLGRQNEVLLGDFGIASIVHSTQSMNVQDQAGTINYMAPEQLQGKPRPASDQYALGVVVYEWICGERPFQGSFVEIHSQHLSVSPPSLRERIPTLPTSVEVVVMIALAKEPRHRFANVSAFARALEHVCGPVPITISQLVAPVTESSDVISSLNNLVEKSPSILAEVPEKVESTEDAADLQDSINKEANVTSELNQAESASLSPFSEVFNYVSANEPPMHAETKFYEGKSVNPKADFRPDVVESPSAHPKNIDYVPTTVTVHLPVAVSETYIKRDLKVTDKSKRSTPVRHKRRRIWLFFLMIITVVILITGFIIVLPGLIHSNVRIIPGTTATVTITPDSKDESNIYQIIGVLSTPNPSMREVSARIISATFPAQSKTVQSSGSIPGTRSSGALTFLNTTTSAQTFGSVILRGASGVPVTFNGPIKVPANPPSSVTVTGFAVNIGSAGNIGALDISGPCCAAGITVKNGAFSGGQDPQPSSAVLQSDINSAANMLTTSLTHGTQAALQKQVHSNEQAVPNTLRCTSAVSANHAAGDHAPNVTVIVSVTCKEEVYDQQAALTMAANLPAKQASTDLGPNYALTGNIVSQDTRVTVVDTKGTLAVLVKADGVWDYQFSDTVLQGFTNHIANMSNQDALNYLMSQPGVKAVKIDNPNSNTLLDDAHIKFVIVAIHVTTGTPTVITGSTGIPPNRVVTPTATPTQGLGAS